MADPATKLSHPPTLADIDALPPHMKGEIIGRDGRARIPPFGEVAIQVAEWWEGSEAE